jgi:hypothetical protein
MRSKVEIKLSQAHCYINGDFSAETTDGSIAWCQHAITPAVLATCPERRSSGNNKPGRIRINFDCSHPGMEPHGRRIFRSVLSSNGAIKS